MFKLFDDGVIITNPQVIEKNLCNAAYLYYECFQVNQSLIFVSLITILGCEWRTGATWNQCISQFYGLYAQFFSSSSCLVWKLTFSVHELENPCSAYDVTGVPTFDARFCAYVEMPNNVSGIKALNSFNWFQIRKNFCGGRWVSAKTPTILQKRLPYWCVWLEVLTEWWKHACDRLHHEYLSWFFAIRKWNLDKQHFCLPLTICPRFGHYPQSIHVAGSSGKTKI